MSTKDIPLYPRQLEILRTPGSEILAVGEGGGKSYAFRAGLVLFASTRRDATCVLIHPNSDELHRGAVDGPTGFKAILAEATQAGVVEIHPGTCEARFANGSKLIWLAMDKAVEKRRLAELGQVELGCVDEAHRVTADQYGTLVVKAAHGNGRVLAAAPQASGWLADRWNGTTPGRVVVATSSADLPADLQVVPALPTMEAFMDGLGEPRLAPDSKFRRARHVKYVTDVIQRWFYGEFDRLMILVPPQHCKTTLGVRVGVAYYEFCRPYETVGLTSYNSSKAQERNQDARGYYQAAGGALAEGSASVGYWKTPYGGGAWAAGPGAGQAGNPMTAGFIDDPDMDMEESRSGAAIRRKEFWYQGTWLGREDKFADRRLRQLVTGTRFWRGDTCGRILDFHAKRGEAWHLCVLPAVYDPEVADYYRSLAPGLFTVEPDFRTEPGDPIYPEEYGADYWALNRRSNIRLFLSIYQQKPEESDGGTAFNEKWPIDLSVDPAFVGGRSARDVYYRPIRGWDLAATAGAGDWTASVSIGETLGSDRIVIRHAARARLGSRGVMRMIAGTMLLDGPDVDIVLPGDPAAAGKHQTGRIVEYLARVASSISVDCLDCEGPTRGVSGRVSSCEACGGSRKIRFRLPLITVVPTNEGITGRFQDFADRATPISEGVEGRVDFVDADWTPSVEDAVPWFLRAVELEEDHDWKEELRQIRLLMHRFTSDEDPDLVWCGWQDPYFRELHLFPDMNHDDWVAATAHAWGAMKGPRSVYPKR